MSFTEGMNVPDVTVNMSDIFFDSYDPQEYCDICPQVARMYATLPSGRDLAFCGHHADKHREALLDQKAYVVELVGEMAS